MLASMYATPLKGGISFHFGAEEGAAFFLGNVPIVVCGFL
jgi:hypothetical protein